MARILIGVSGGIAAYKAVELVRLSIKAGHSVRVLATPSTERFVGRATFEGITGAPVLVTEFDSDPLRGAFPGEPAAGHLPIGHLEVAERADAMVIAPASANTIAKLAAGICDSALTTAFCAFDGPVLVAPAMNERMYMAAATVENLARLRERGVVVIEPGYGDLASKGEHGLGRLAAPETVMAEVESALAESGSAGAVAGDLKGVRVLVTAGGTREAIDPIRFLGNRSSGRMGIALAAAARDRGAAVTLIGCNLAVPPPGGVRTVEVETTDELASACESEFAECDILIMAAAPADFRPVEVADEKLRREDAGLRLDLVPTADILASLSAKRRSGQRIVGFAAEAGGDIVESASAKLGRKGVDMIVLNDVSDGRIGFDSERNAVTLITAEGRSEVTMRPKREVADSILDRVGALGGEAGADSGPMSATPGL